MGAYAAPGVYTVRSIAGSDWVGDNGPARDSLLLQAEGLAADRDGNLYISDAQSHRVRQISPEGIIRTIAGTGISGFAGDGGPAVVAQLSAPYGLAVDTLGNVFIADLGNHRIRRVARDGTISTVSAQTSFRAPRNLATDASGNLYVSDFESGFVYKIGLSGIAAVVAVLKYPAGLAVDRNGALYIGETGTHLVRKLENGTIRTVTTVTTPTGLAFDAQGTLHIADGNGGGIFRIPVTGTATPLAIPARDVASAPGGVLYSTDGKLIRRIVTSGNTVIAGRGDPAHGDYGPATEARLNNPNGLALDAAGNLYIADRDNHRIRRVDPDGIIATFAGSGFAGNDGDGGLAAAASLNQPTALSLDNVGNLFIADQGNGRIRMVTPSGIIFATPSMPSPADIPLPSLQSDQPMLFPTSIVAGKNGILYVADADRDRVWELTPAVVPPDPSTLISIVNAASLTGPLAPGMLAMIQGVSLTSPEVLFDNSTALVLSNKAVVVPANLPPGLVDAEIRDKGQSIAHITVAIVPAAPALFVAVNEYDTVNDPAHPAERGSVLTLYGTGQGVEAQPATVRIGAYDAEVLYSGPVSAYPGLWQVNARVPGGFFAGGSLPLTVAVGTVVSPPLQVETK